MSTQDHFRNLALAAMPLAAEVLDAATEEQQQQIDRAMRGGATLFMEFGPLPAFTHATLYLIEHEGKRTRLGTISVMDAAAH